MKENALLRNLAMPVALVAIAAFFAIKEPSYLGSRNLTQLLIEFVIVATLALGMFLIILTGNIDLSVGSGVGLLGGIAAVLVFEHGWGAMPAMLASTAVGLLLWALMGALIVKERIPSFIVTLGGMLIFKGLFWRVINSATVPVSRGGEDNAYSLLTTHYLSAQHGLLMAAVIVVVVGLLRVRGRAERARYELPNEPWLVAAGKFAGIAVAVFGVVQVCNGFRGVPLSLVVMAACAVAIHFLTRHTPFGRYLYAIGGNEEAAVLSGISVRTIVIGAFVIMGLMTAITGFMATAYIGSSTTTVGDLMELDAIAACVIGGTALKGGRGTVWGVLLGALIMTALLNGMGLLGVDPWIKYVARGTVLTLAVWTDVRFGRG